MARGATALLLAALLPTLAQAVSSSRLSPRTLPPRHLPSPQACAERIVDKLEQPHEALSVTATKANGSLLCPLELLWAFSRPHTRIGSAICIPALSLFAGSSSVPAATLLSVLIPLVSYATLPSLLINSYITGLNQLFDVEMGKVNKPKLPLASGEVTLKQG